MHRGIVEINKVPTVVETWGRWIEESPKRNENIVLCIPGNPGVTGYYRKFLEPIYEKLQCNVWIVGHAGHQIIDSKSIKIPNLEDHKNLYDVAGQTDHKVEFFRKYIPGDAKVFIIGHSIGAHITLNLLKHPDIKSRVVKTYCIFPTIEDMVQTPNGQFLTNYIKCFTSIIYFFMWIFTLFPIPVQMFLLSCYFVVVRAPTENSIATKDLMHPAVLNKIFFMAFDEMDLVCALDKSLIEPHIDKIKLYYGATDNWAPVSYYRKLVEKYPNLDAELCVRKFEHAFVLRQSEDVGKMVAEWIETDRK